MIIFVKGILAGRLDGGGGGASKGIVSNPVPGTSCLIFTILTIALDCL
jgi:hypothetical protein